jgi:pimeloyl-ACP methyl ester carboxylesterase
MQQHRDDENYTPLQQYGIALLLLGVAGLVIPVLAAMVLVVLGVCFVAVDSLWLLRRIAQYKIRHPEKRHDVEWWESRVLHALRGTRVVSAYDTPTLGDAVYHIATTVPNAPVRAVCVMVHGASGTADDVHFQHVRRALAVEQCAVVGFDAQRGIASGGYEHTAFTVSSMLTDVGAVLSWVREQYWARHVPVLLYGHSAGATAAGVYAAQHPEHVSGIILLTPTISGARYVQQYEIVDPEGLKLWREQGMRSVTHPLRSGRYTMSWQFVEDLQQYDLCTTLKNVTIPVGVIAGGADTVSGEHVAKVLDGCVPRGRYTPQTEEHMGHTPENTQDIVSVGDVCVRMVRRFLVTDGATFSSESVEQTLAHSKEVGSQPQAS